MRLKVIAKEAKHSKFVSKKRSSIICLQVPFGSVFCYLMHLNSFKFPNVQERWCEEISEFDIPSDVSNVWFLIMQQTALHTISVSLQGISFCEHNQRFPDQQLRDSIKACFMPLQENYYLDQDINLYTNLFYMSKHLVCAILSWVSTKDTGCNMVNLQLLTSILAEMSISGRKSIYISI